MYVYDYQNNDAICPHYIQLILYGLFIEWLLNEQISHAATSAGLSDRQKFPNFFRTAIAESTHNAARLAFLRLQQWDSVSVLVQNEDDYSLVGHSIKCNISNKNL